MRHSAVPDGFRERLSILVLKSPVTIIHIPFCDVKRMVREIFMVPLHYAPEFIELGAPLFVFFNDKMKKWEK